MTYTLITGASGGIGVAFAKKFAQQGHNLILVARNEANLRKAKEEIKAGYSVEIEIILCDLAMVDAAQELYALTTQKGFEVDHLVNNAGFGDHAGFLDSDWSRQYEMVQLNITALMQLTYLYGNDMRKNGFGRILNVSSVAAFSAGPYMSVYYATKGYVLSFSQAVHAELKGTGVTVTALCPGPTRTNFEQNANMKGSKMFSFVGSATAEDVVECGYRVMMKGKPCVYHGLPTKLMNIGSRLAPRNVSTFFAKLVDGIPGGKHDGKD